jgi:hypothetical protein
MKRSFRFILIAVLLTGVGVLSFAQGLAVGTAKPVVDGVIDAAQYGYTQDFGQMTLYFQRTADTLYVGVVGKTAGWVAVGLDSMKMDAAPIFMGFVQDGKAQFTTQMGRGHSHQEAATSSVISYAMKEQGGTTVLEVALKASQYIAADQKELDAIYAIGPAKNFSAYHSFRGAMKVPLM